MIGRSLDQGARAVMLTGLVLMLTLSLVGIVARWLGLSFMWLDPLVRHLVLITAFGGGVVAVGKKNHIKIDLLSHPIERMSSQGRSMVQVVLALATALVTAALTWSAWLFYLSEQEYGAHGLLGIHSSLWVLIFPIGWGAMTLRWVSSIFEREGKN